MVGVASSSVSSIHVGLYVSPLLFTHFSSPRARFLLPRSYQTAVSDLDALFPVRYEYRSAEILVMGHRHVFSYARWVLVMIVTCSSSTLASASSLSLEPESLLQRHKDSK